MRLQLKLPVSSRLHIDQLLEGGMTTEVGGGLTSSVAVGEAAGVLAIVEGVEDAEVGGEVGGAGALAVLRRLRPRVALRRDPEQVPGTRGQLALLAKGAG